LFASPVGKAQNLLSTIRPLHADILKVYYIGLGKDVLIKELFILTFSSHSFFLILREQYGDEVLILYISLIFSPFLKLFR